MLVASCEKDCSLENPTDSDVEKFVGNLKVVRLGAEAERLDVSNVVVCHMIAPNDSIISRKATVKKENYGATVTFEVGLADGIYRMLYFEYEITSSEETRVKQYGLGCQVEIKVLFPATSRAFWAWLACTADLPQQSQCILLTL